MAARIPFKLTFKRVEKHLHPEMNKVTVTPNKQKIQIDDAYKEFFASLLKIKDKDVQRRVLQAVNNQNLTCANCANKIQSKGVTVSENAPTTPVSFSFATQTLDKDFEFLKKINSSPKSMNTTGTITNNNNTECFMLNKIQLGRPKRKFEPYAVKTEREEGVTSNNKMSRYEPNGVLKINHKPTTKIENSIIRTIPNQYSITEKLLFDNLDSTDDSMTPHVFFNFKQTNDPPTKLNDFIFLSTMEEEMRTVDTCNDEGLYTIHIATINGDLFKLRRLMVIYKYYKRNVNICSMDGKTPLHFAMSCINNVRNNEIISLLYDSGGDVSATNDIGDTVLHLAAETIYDRSLITKLLSKIGVDDLSKQNDKGQTILHVAAANKNRIFVKSILDLIDEKLNISSIGEDIPFKNDVEYFKQLDTLHLNYVKSFINENFKKPSINAVKAKILNQQDGRSGKTAVFLSLDNNDRSTCSMLLAHFADTRIQDFSNTSCAFYSSEILKNQILAQAIYHADSMHNAVVVRALKQTERHRLNESRKRVAQIDFNENGGNGDDEDDGNDIMAKVAKVFS